MRLSQRMILGVMLGITVTAVAGAAEQTLPADWLSRWNHPPAEDRPLQIVHGIPSNRATPDGMRYYTDRGLGGVVCNVAFDKYMQSEEHWKTLIVGVEACKQLGMVVWLYDEEGYPSGPAGGLVLEENPAFEATVLAFDPSSGEKLTIRPAYEHTHAANNFYMARRYPNLIDDRATRCFIAKTHEAYWRRLEPHFGSTIRAIFTDEPSLLAVDTGQLGEEVRSKVRVTDPIDPTVKPLATVPWGYDLPERYRQRYGEDLLPHRRSLFAGNTTEDRRVRRQFWALIADLVAERYFGQIGRWCARHRIASSGHCLWEEELIHHVPLMGNALKVLTLMDVPGLDMLSSDPQVVRYRGWLTAGLPASAAALSGRRRVMTEVSDFIQKMGDDGPAELTEMQATAAWQAAWGVTDFTLYYGPGDRSVEDYRAYCTYVGRLNAVLKPARPDPQVLLYYPIYDLWAEYLPVAGPLKIESQSARAQRLVASFMRLGEMLQRNQIPFALIDHEHLAAATVRPSGKLAIKEQRYETLLLPEGTELPAPAAQVAEQFRQRGGRVLRERQLTARPAGQSVADVLQPAYRVSPPSESIALGRFVREGRRVLLIVNVGPKTYGGHLSADESGTWHVMDPASGAIRPAACDPAGRVRLALAARQAVLLVQANDPTHD